MQVCHSNYCLDGVSGVPKYVPVPVHVPVPGLEPEPIPVPALLLCKISTALLSFKLKALQVRGTLDTSVDLFYNTSVSLNIGVDVIRSVFTCHHIYDVINTSELLHQSFHFVVQPFARFFSLLLQDPYFRSIHMSYHDLFLSLILMYSLHCIPLEEPSILSYLAFLRASCNMFLRHDFLAWNTSLSTAPHTPLPWLFLVIKVSLFFQYPFQIALIQVQHSSYYFTSADLRQSAVPAVDSFPERRSNSYDGGRQHMFTFEEVGTCIVGGYDVDHDSAFKFIDHVDSTGRVAYPIDQNYIYADVPLPVLIPYLSFKMIHKISKLHHVNLHPCVTKSDSELVSSFLGHSCVSCNLYSSVFSVIDSKAAKDRKHKQAKIRL